MRIAQKLGALGFAALFATLVGACSSGGGNADHAIAPPEPLSDVPQGLTAGYAEGSLHFPVGVALGGYGARYEGAFGIFMGGPPNEPPEGELRPTPFATLLPPSIGIQNIPFAKAIALTLRNASGEESTLVLCHNEAVLTVDPLRQKIIDVVKARTGFDLSQRLIVVSNHTHASAGPFWNQLLAAPAQDTYHGEIFERMAASDIDVVIRALQARAPARIGMGIEHDLDPLDDAYSDRRFENNDADLVTNGDISRADPETGELITDGKPDGKIKDDRLVLFRVDKADGTPLVALPLFPIHGTCLTPRNLFMSGDAPGLVEQKTEEEIGGGVAVIHLQGSTGDIQPGNLDPAKDKQFFDGEEHIGEILAPRIKRVFEATATSSSLAGIQLTTVHRRQDREIMGYNDPGLEAPYTKFTAPFGAVQCGTVSDLANYVPFPLPRISDPFQCLTQPSSFNERILAFTFAKAAFPLLMDDLNANAYTDDILRDVVIGVNPVGGPYEKPANLFYTTFTSALLQGIQVTDLEGGPSGTRNFLLAAVPGEATTPLAMELRRKTVLGTPGVDFGDTVVLSYAQDHQGYILLKEDWVQGGGREIGINPWGPLWGEWVMRESTALSRSVVTGDAPPRNQPIPVEDPIPFIPVRPSSSIQPGPREQPKSADRFDPTVFSFIGGDPAIDVPHTVLQRETPSGSGVFADVVKTSGRIMDEGDYETILIYDWDETNRAEPHLWSIHWETDARTVTGKYRWVVEGTNFDKKGQKEGREPPYYTGSPYSFTSDPFAVGPSPALWAKDLLLSRSSFSVSVLYPPRYPDNAQPNYALYYRYRPAGPLSAPYRIVVKSGRTVVLSADGTIGADGHAELPSPIPPGTYSVDLSFTDPYGNTGSQGFSKVNVP